MTLFAEQCSYLLYVAGARTGFDNLCNCGSQVSKKVGGKRIVKAKTVIYGEKEIDKAKESRE